MSGKVKKPIWKRWLFCVAIVLVIWIGSGCGKEETSPANVQEVTQQEEQTVETTKEATEELTEDEPENAEESNVEDVELTEKEKIEKAVQEIVENDFNRTTINKLQVNENLGLDDGSYIVLPYLKWEVRNNADLTREMLEMYSDHLAAMLAEYNVSEVTVFWEVPYHLEGNNVAKMNYQRHGDGMAIGERWYDQVLQ